jgi:hypothetical protein
MLTDTLRYDTGEVENGLNRCHAMIHHQNADAMVLASMVLASARLRGISPQDVRHFEYYQGVNASQTRTG